MSSRGDNGHKRSGWMDTWTKFKNDGLTLMGSLMGELMGSCKVAQYCVFPPSVTGMSWHWGVRWVNASLGNLAQYLDTKTK